MAIERCRDTVIACAHPDAASPARAAYEKGELDSLIEMRNHLFGDGQ